MPININAVLHEIPRLEMDSLTQAKPAVQQYFAHYGIDFATSLDGVSQHIGHFSSGNYDLVGQLYLRQDARATVFMVHGYFDHVGLYGSLIAHLLARRYNVVAFDLPGHGLSSGEAASIASFSHYDRALEDFVRLCRTHLPEPWHIVAQSTGGAAVMSYLMRESRHPFDKIALLAPLVRPMHWPLGKWAHFGVSRFTSQIARNFRDNSHDLDFVEFVKTRDPLQSRYLKLEWIAAMGVWLKWFLQLPAIQQELLVIQGDGDTTVDWRYNVKVIQQKFPAAKIFKVHRARHHLVGESDEIRAGAFKALDRYLSGRRLPEEEQPAAKKRRFQRKT